MDIHTAIGEYDNEYDYDGYEEDSIWSRNITTTMKTTMTRVTML